MTIEDFDQVCDQFTNKRLFESDNTGNFKRDKDRRLIKINDDNI